MFTYLGTGSKISVAITVSNIRGALMFVNFAQNPEKIFDNLYAHFEHVGVY